jgi:hypothetical protein
LVFIKTGFVIKGITVIFIIFSSAQFAWGQDLPNRPGEMGIALKLEDFGINKKSRFYLEPSNDESDSPQRTSLPDIIYKGVKKHKHYDQGQTIQVQKKPTLTDTQKKEINEKSKIILENNLKIVTAIKRIPNCHESGKETVSLESKGFPDGKVIIKDILILRHYQIPEDTAEIFGPTVEVIAYKDDQEDDGYRIAHALAARCLPWRIRIALEKTEMLQGKNALLNFSRGSKAKPFLHREAKGIVE